jgi:hypothetical protein
VLGVEKEKDMIDLMKGVERGEEYMKATIAKIQPRPLMTHSSKSTSVSVTVIWLP